MEQPKVKRQYKKKVQQEPVTVEVNIVKTEKLNKKTKKSVSNVSENTKKTPSKFSLFVKNNYEKVRNLPNQDRMKALAKMYHEEKSKQ
jgi:hypothetical protein